jgi:superfamily II DNA or RNA helicase
VDLFGGTGRRPELRTYQRGTIDHVQAAWAAGRRAVLACQPTGAGKTVLAAALIEAEVAAGGRALFVAPRRELVDQTLGKLRDVGIEPHVEMAGALERAGRDAPVWLASIDTLRARAQRRGTLVLPDFSLIVVDEAHQSITQPRVELLERWPKARLLGLTATPGRKDGRALGLLYDELIQPVTVADLTRDGWLVPAHYWSWSPDLRGVRIARGDYVEDELAARMNQPRLLGDIVEHATRHAADRRTVVFCVSIKHAIALAEAFRAVGIAAEHVDAKTPAPARAATFARFRAGTTQVLTNCFLVSLGFDLPPVSCVVLARPTKSLVLYLQMVGRGLRPDPETDKRDCYVLDHAGCVHEHGFAADPRHWTLHGRMAIEPTPRGAPAKAKAKECPRCQAIFTGSNVCPECGYALRPQGQLVPTLAGELVEIGAGEEPDTQERQVFYLELRGYASARGYKAGWAAYKYRERHGAFPAWAWNALPALQPSPATRRWIKSRLIAWARAKGRAA